MGVGVGLAVPCGVSAAGVPVDGKAGVAPGVMELAGGGVVDGAPVPRGVGGIWRLGNAVASGRRGVADAAGARGVVMGKVAVGGTSVGAAIVGVGTGGVTVAADGAVAVA